MSHRILRRWAFQAVTGLAVGVGAAGPVAAQTTQPIVTRNASLRLPISLDDRTRAEVSEVRLHVRGPNGRWMLAQSAPPTQSTFDFRAPGDGEYWFTFVTVDRRGRTSPANVETAPPHRIVVVDTKPTKAALPSVVQPPREAANVAESSVRPGIEKGKPDPARFPSVEPDRGGPPPGPLNPVRQAEPIRAPMLPPDVGVPDLKLPDVKIPDMPAPPTAVAPPTPTPLPSGGGLELKLPDVAVPDAPGVKPLADKLPDVPVPKPPVEPVPELPVPKPEIPAIPDLPAKSPDVKLPDVPAPMKAGGPGALPDLPPLQTPVADVPPIPDLPAVKPPSVKEALEKANDAAGSRLLPGTAAPAKETTSLKPAEAPTKAPGTSHPVLNTRTCVINYESEGPVRVAARIDFWATKDGGRTWEPLRDEAGGIAPARLTLPGEGVFGIRIRPGAGSKPPEPGEDPDCVVEVDTTKPAVNLLQPTIGTGADEGTMLITWTAADKNLLSNSVNLFYATQSEGPWQEIAKGYKNEGVYRWAMPTGLTGDIFVRLEATDRAGNVGRHDLNTPVALDTGKGRVKVTGVGPGK